MAQHVGPLATNRNKQCGSYWIRLSCRGTGSREVKWLFLGMWSTKEGGGAVRTSTSCFLLTNAISVSPSWRQRREINKGRTISANRKVTCNLTGRRLSCCLLTSLDPSERAWSPECPWGRQRQPRESFCIQRALSDITVKTGRQTIPNYQTQHHLLI